jgi:hypothetical protein
MFGSDRAPSWRRSWIVTKPIRSACRSALCTVRTHASAGGNLADGSGAAASVPVLVCDDAHDGHLARRELVGEV